MIRFFDTGGMRVIETFDLLNVLGLEHFEQRETVLQIFFFTRSIVVNLHKVELQYNSVAFCSLLRNLFTDLNASLSQSEHIALALVEQLLQWCSVVMCMAMW